MESQAISDLGLVSRFVGGLPLVNHILNRLQVVPLLQRALPAGGKLDTADSARLNSDLLT